ncbi:MAG: ABC transporter ATP-binding protein [Candidatus Desulforudis sp.]|nr:ABC transporter ATP-binding protein [Desulforudis sp.]
MALANDPGLIILDEPTSGLDTVTRRDILALLHGLSGRCALLLLTHDLAAASALAGRTAVLYRGQVVEEGPSGKVLRGPRHPYTRGLLRAYPNMTTTKDLQGIPGRAHRTHGGHGGLHPHTHDYTHHPHPHGTHRHGPEADPATGDGRSRHRGCPFHPRCTQAVAPCPTTRPPLAGEEDGHRLACHRGGIVPLLQVRGISKRYGAVRALEQVTLTLYEGETLAVVGQSGSGKTTLANVIMGLTAPEAGEVWLEQEKVARRDRDFYRRVQMVFQDPAASISHRHTVLQAVAEPLLLHLGGRLQDHTDTVRRVLEEVQLPSDDLFLQRYPHHMSGGENQRVAIARALTLGPKLLVADEPTSALDASIQAKIFRLLLQLQEERGLALLLITHDLALARKVCDRLVVLQAGRVIETGPSDQITTSPVHPHTRTLVAAAPAFCSGCENK